MSQGGSRRPYSRGGPRWHPRYKDYWDYEQNYSDGSSAGSPKEACVQSPTPAKREPRPVHQNHIHHDQRRLSIGGGAGDSRRAERRAAGPSDRRRPEMRVSPGAGPSAEPPHFPPHHHTPHHLTPHHLTQHHHTPHHHMDTNPLEAVEGVVSGPSSDGELSSKAGDSPSRKRRRISRHLSAGESNVSVTAPPVERRTPRLYHTQRRARFGSWHDVQHHHVHPLLLDVNQMSLRGARLGALPGAVSWGHAPHPAHPAHPAHAHPAHAHPAHAHQHPAHQHPAHQHPAHQHPAHQHPAHAHREHPQRTQRVVPWQVAAGELWPSAVLPPLSLRYQRVFGTMYGGGVQMGGVYAGLQYAAGFPAPPPPPPRAPFASSPHPHTHYLPPTQRESGRVEAVGGEGTLSPLHAAADIPLLLAAEPRGAPLELMAPHHSRHHALSHHHHAAGRRAAGGSARAARAYLRAPRYTPHIHHIHQSGGGIVGAALPAHVQAQLHVASLPPPPPYQVFLNLLAMFPLSPYTETRSESPESPEPENYEALLSLAELLGEAKPRGLARAEIDLLPSYKYTESSRDGEQTSCVVCMCEFEVRQVVRVLPCAHQFHARCVDKWLRSNRTCPICRGNASDYFTNAE